MMRAKTEEIAKKMAKQSYWDFIKDNKLAFKELYLDNLSDVKDGIIDSFKALYDCIKDLVIGIWSVLFTLIIAILQLVFNIGFILNLIDLIKLKREYDKIYGENKITNVSDKQNSKMKIMKLIFIIILALVTATLLITGIGFLCWFLAEDGQIGIAEFKIVLIGICKSFAVALSIFLSVILFKVSFDFITKYIK